MNTRRPSRLGASQTPAKVMPTISDVSSDNSEGGAPLHDGGLTFSQMKMNQAARNQAQREAAAAAVEESTPTKNHVPDRRPNGAHASVAAPMPAAKQQPNGEKDGKAHKLNPASDMFIPSSATYNDLTKIQNQDAENQSLLMQLLEKKERKQKEAIEEQKARHNKNGITKSSSSGSYAGSIRSTISSEQGHSVVNAPVTGRVSHHQADQSQSYQNGYGQYPFGSSSQLNHAAGASSGDQDTDTSSQARTQQGSPMPLFPPVDDGAWGAEKDYPVSQARTQKGPKTPKPTKPASSAVFNGTFGAKASKSSSSGKDKGKGKAPSNALVVSEYQPLPPIPDLNLGSAQCRDIVVFQAADDAARAERSGMLNSIVPASGVPSESVLTHPDNLPFTTTAEDSIASAKLERGVIHLDNIPFGTSRAEVIAFVGKNSRLLNDSEEPVHIIMDRVTSKTQDIYVEFATPNDAQAVLDRFEYNIASGRHPRLGDRPIRMHLSSPSRLMRALFPVARGLDWYGYIPHIHQPNPHDAYENFSVFISDEELSMVAKHAEEPRRSPFSKDARERPYECLISTVKKFPWYMTGRLTLLQQYKLYECCFKLLGFLNQALVREECPGRLTPQLLKRFTDAMMLCPGFTVLQKDNFAHTVRMSAADMCKFNMPPVASGWRHQYALGPRAGFPMDVMEYYIATINKESSRHAMDDQDVAMKVTLKKMQGLTSDYWGYFWHEVGYYGVHQFDKLTVEMAARMEWAAIDKVLRRALSHARKQRAHRSVAASNNDQMPTY
ncbi:RNA recognition- RNP-1 [Apiospora marii]|uniref:RNA recognition- RNP-1 n=1 Tax=Apiospora marii TaxID=335849 RepID=A0ABR1T3R4_9PEZI